MTSRSHEPTRPIFQGIADGCTREPPHSLRELIEDLRRKIPLWKETGGLKWFGAPFKWECTWCGAADAHKQDCRFLVFLNDLESAIRTYATEQVAQARVEVCQEWVNRLSVYNVVDGAIPLGGIAAAIQAKRDG